MTPETAVVVSAAIGAFAAVAVAVVGVVGTRQHRHTRAALADNTDKTAQVLHQVKNDHGTNLRDDLDMLAETVAGHTLGIADVEAGQARIASMLGKVRKTVDEVQAGQKAHDVASALVVDELHRADRALAAEIAIHHPRS